MDIYKKLLNIYEKKNEWNNNIKKKNKYIYLFFHLSNNLFDKLNENDKNKIENMFPFTTYKNEAILNKIINKIYNNDDNAYIYLLILKCLNIILLLNKPNILNNQTGINNTSGINNEAKLNEEIKRLNDEIKRLNDEITKLNAEISKLKDENTEKNSEISKLKDENTENGKLQLKYNNNCNKILFDESNIKHLEKEYSLNLKILYDNIQRSTTESEKDFLFCKLLYLHIDSEFIKQLLTDNIEWKCSNILSGGGYKNNNEINNKLIKYYYKYSTNLNNKNIYKYKIKNYIETKQLGGSSHIFYSLNIYDKIIDNILDNKYNYIFDNIKKLNTAVTPATELANFDTIDETSTDNNLIKQFNIKKDSYFDNYILQDTHTNTDNNNFSDIKYNYNRFLKTSVTDIFIKEIYTNNNDYFLKLLNYVYIEILKTFNEFIYKFKIVNPSFNTKSVNLLYKSGNTSRLHLSNFIKIIKNKLDTTSSKSTEDKEKIIKEIEKKLEYEKNVPSDFDYNISIDYTLITNEQLRDKLLMGIYQVIVLALFRIKSKLSKLLNVKNISNNFITLLKEYFTSTETINITNTYINNINTINNDSKKIKKIELKSIKTNNYKYLNNEITKDYDNTTIDTTSYEAIVNDTNITITKLYSFFSNDAVTDFLPNFLMPDNIYIVFIRKIEFLTNQNKNSFSLFRLKLNNYLKYDYTLNNESIKAYKFRIPVELIDISINLPEDSKLKYIKHYIKNESKLYTTLKNFKNNINTDFMKIPSADYMFFDIAKIIFNETLFAFNDLKYVKRIKRLLNLSIISLLQDEDEDEYEYNKLNKLINKIENLKYFIMYDRITSFLEEGLLKITIDTELNIYSITHTNEYNNINHINIFFKTIIENYILMVLYCFSNGNITNKINSNVYGNSDTTNKINENISSLTDIESIKTKLTDYTTNLNSILQNLIDIIKTLISEGITELDITYNNIDQLI
jgi:hypothetical protein